jgi:hypothetical protein
MSPALLVLKPKSDTVAFACVRVSPLPSENEKLNRSAAGSEKLVSPSNWLNESVVVNEPVRWYEVQFAT